MDDRTGYLNSSGSPTPDGGDAARYRHLIEHVQDAVVEFKLVEGRPVIVGVNPAFEEVFGYDAEKAVGKLLNDLIVPPWLADEAANLDERTAAGQVNYRHVRRQTADGLGEFLYRGIPYEEGRGFAVYTDLTTANRRERRLEVLNRLLRHNLRNSVNVVVGAAESVREGDDEALRMLESGASDLLRLTEEATEIHRTLTETLPGNPTLDCVPLLETVVTEYRERHPEATIRTDLPGSLPATATDRLGAAVGALVENAVVHHDGDPTVWVAAESVGDSEWVDITVADDGPGIPAAEREVITGEAEITPTRHGTGLGLWLAKWTVERYGGTLAFEGSDASGTRVRLRLYRGD
jgi:PAS domain S-box-containing protein